MTTTQGTAGLIQRLAAAKRECGLANYEGTLAHVTIPQVLKQAELVLGEALAFVSAKPAPVAEPVAHVIEERSTRYISAEDAMQSGLGYSAGSFPVVNLSITMLPGKHTPPAGTKFYLHPPAPELAVADEGRFEELLDDYVLAHDRFIKGGSLQDSAKARVEVLRAFKASRSPVQEGAIDDETRDALEIAIVCIQQLERMSREIDSTPATIKGEPIMRHIAALERLREQ